jgi:DNA polymerase III delta prime subunit
MSKQILKITWKKRSRDQTFISRHQPQSLYDLILNTEQRSKLTRWFELVKQSSNQGLFLIGPPGSGKTSVVRVFCQHYGYTVKEFNAFDCRNKKIIDNVIMKMIENVPIDSQMYHKKQYAIVIDELECMADKNSLNTIIKLINQKKKSQTSVNIPLIFISNETTEKKINELKKHCTELRFARPNRDQLISLIDKILFKEKLVVHQDRREEIHDLIVNTSDGDYRRLINLMDFIIGQSKERGNGTKISYDLVTQCLYIFQEKYQDHDIYQNTVKLFTCKTINESIRIYENDKSLLPMMVHENYSYLVGSKYSRKRDQLKTSLKIINNVIQGDLIDKVMYNTQSWHYYTIHSLMSCYLPSYLSWHLAKRPEIKFTTTLGKHSLQSSNKKKFLSVLSTIGNGKSYSTSDLYYLGNIIRYHATNPKGNIEVIKSLMKTYNLTFDIIDRIIRFSKLGEDVNYGIKIKNQLKQHLQGVKITKYIQIDDD